MKAKLQIVVVMAAILFSACAMQPPVVPDIVGSSVLPEPLQKQIRASEKIKSLKAYAAANVIVNGSKKAVDLAIVVEKPDKIRIDFIDPLAGVFLTMMSSGGNVVFADPSGNMYSDTDTNKMEIERVTGFPLAFGEMIDILLGSAASAFMENTKYKFDNKGKFWNNNLSGAVFPKAGGYEYISVKNERLILSVSYAGFKNESGGLFPTEMAINVPDKKASLDIKYQNYTINGKITGNPFDEL